MNTLLLITGLLSVYFGYRLFCSISRRALSVVAGAALAMFGMSILVSEARAFVGHRTQSVSDVHRPTNWHNGAAHSSHNGAHLQNII